MSDVDSETVDVANAPCGSCGRGMYECFSFHMQTGGSCCPNCDKHGFRVTERGEAVLDALDDGWSFDDATTLHGKRR